MRLMNATGLSGELEWQETRKPKNTENRNLLGIYGQEDVTPSLHSEEEIV
jgi:hypothetical protein